METIKPRTPSGFPEYLPEDQIEFNRLKGIIEETYQRYGFSPLDTPDAELREVLLAKSAGETEKQVYGLVNGSAEEAKNSDKLCLRFDLTVPLARYAAEHYNDLVFPFRRYHIGRVHRGERAQAGRFREFYQCDIDVIGSNSPVVDAEIPAVINEIFTKFAFGGFVIRINDRRILNGFFESLGLSDQKTDVMRLVDKIEKMPLETFKEALKDAGLNPDQVGQLIALTEITGSNDETLSKLSALGVDNTDFAAGLENLKTLVPAIRALGVPEENFAIDLKIARGLDYYTGTVYETMLKDYPKLGSVCSGGRYDNLASHYTSKELPGVGMSIGLSRLFYKLKELGVVESSRKSPADIIILPMSPTEFPYAAKVAAALRTGGRNALLYSEEKALNKMLSYADKMGMSFAIIIGASEVESSSVTLKNMRTGENQFVKLENLLKTLQAAE